MQMQTDWRPAGTPTIAQATDAAVKMHAQNLFSRREALRMDAADGAKLMRAMRRHLVKNDLDHWATSFFRALHDQASGQPTGRAAGRESTPLSNGRGGAQG